MCQCEHENYHRITPYVIVSDEAGDFNHITRPDPGEMIRVNHARRSRKEDGLQNTLRMNY
jgi:hypothetical protein